MWGANEEADDGAFALVNGDAEAVPPAGCMAVISKRPVGPEVGDECQVRHAEGTVVRSVHPVNFRDKLQGAKHYLHKYRWDTGMGGMHHMYCCTYVVAGSIIYTPDFSVLPSIFFINIINFFYDYIYNLKYFYIIYFFIF